MDLPRTLWLHISAQLWRVLLLTAVILVSVISFAAGIKPLAEGKLGPAEMLKFVLLAMPPMLAYAVPFAAGFAATLAYHRLGQDNEATAAHAGGISHRSLLVPAMATGLLLAGAMGVLNEQVIPRFLRSMEQLITQDLTKLMVGSIKRGEPISIGPLHLHADDVVVRDPASSPQVAATGATDWLELSGVVFVETDSQGAIRNEVLFKYAPVLLLQGPREDGSEGMTAWVYPREGVGLRGDQGLMAFDELRPIPLAVPNAFEDDPKFLTFGELARLRSQPDQMSFIRTRSQDLAHHLAERATTELIAGELERAQRVRVDRGGSPLVIRASGIRWDPRELMWRLLPAEGQTTVGVDRRRGERQELVEHNADAAWLYTELRTDDKGIDLTLSLYMRGVTTRETTDGSMSGQREEMLFENIRPTRDPLPELLELGADDLLALAAPRVDTAEPDTFLVAPVQELRKRLARLEREILSKQHERLAMAAAALVMVVTGSIVALRLRDASTLTVYLWSFFPALGSIIIISAGQQATHDRGAEGLIVLWAGVLVPAAYAIYAYLGLRKH